MSRGVTAFGNYEFVEGVPPSNFTFGYDISIFNSRSYRSLQGGKSWKEFHVLRRDESKILASVFFFIDGNEAFSPYKASFGSLELSNKINTEVLYYFIAYYEGKLRERRITKIVIKNYPEQYHLVHHNMLSVVLFNHEYVISNAELGACIPVGKELLSDRMDKWERRKYKQSEKANLVFRPLPIRSLEDVYSFIHGCRMEKGYPLSMSLAELNKTSAALKGSFQLFGVFQDEELVAASISIHVNRRVLYNFYSAHNKKFDQLSPVVFLICSMHSWCHTKKISLLDLGTSALGGTPNFSLIDFKLRLGAIPSMKLTFEKNMA